MMLTGAVFAVLSVVVTCSPLSDNQQDDDFKQFLEGNKLDIEALLKDVKNVERWPRSEADDAEYIFNNKFPEMKMTTPEIIWYNKHQAEEHLIETKDGYLLALHRIKAKTSKVKGVVLLQHGLLAASSCWVFNRKNDSLGFVLAEAGYDVWLGNNRGNTYSKRHRTLTTSDSKFWDFSFDEMARYDIPAMVDYVRNATNSDKIHYIGHSQGSTQAFIELGRNPDLNNKLHTFIALGPVANINHAKGLIALMKYLVKAFQAMYYLVGDREFMSHSWIMKFTANYLCALPWTAGKMCANMLYMMNGFDELNLNKTRLPVYLAHMPAGASLKDFIHFAQNFKDKRFVNFDYGWKKNFVRYGTMEPEQYSPEKITVPVALFSGENDWIANLDDVAVLRNKLNTVFHDQMEPGWNHLDFYWATNAGKTFFPGVLKVLGRAIQ